MIKVRVQRWRIQRPKDLLWYSCYVTETINCPFCSTSASEPVIHENGFTGRQCASCGLIFISPRPSREEMAQLYVCGKAYMSPELFLSTSRSLSERIVASDSIRRLRRNVSSGSLLEIGPGNGTFLSRAQRAGFDVYGVELNPSQAEFIRKRNIPCVTSLDAATTIGPDLFDVVYHCDVLSHFHYPITEFEQINALLKPGAYHVFQTGNFGESTTGISLTWSRFSTRTICSSTAKEA